MKAWVLHDINNIKYEEISIPEPKEGEVLVKIMAAGVCGSDIPRIYKDGAHKMPLIPGHEFSGEVVALGKWVDGDWIHKRVGIYPLIPCRECISCHSGNYEMCKNYSYIGSRQNGAFAEYVTVPVNNLIALPESVSFEQAAMLEPMSVAVHAMRQITPSQNDTVVVHGLGTIGLLLVMFLLEKGISNIFVIGNKKSQQDVVLKLGIPPKNYCDSREQDVVSWLYQNSNNIGVNVVFECVGKSETISRSVEFLAPKGKLCVVGNPHADIYFEKNIYWKILRQQLTIVGTWNSSFIKSVHNCDEYGYYQEATDWEYVLHKLEEKRVLPEQLITHRYSLGTLEQGLHMMRDKSEEYIKVMIGQ